VIYINKDSIRVKGDPETIGAEFMIISNTIRKNYGFKPSDLAFLVRAAYDLEEDKKAEPFTVILTKGRGIFDLGNN